MTQKKTNDKESIIAKELIEAHFSDEIEKSYLEYALKTIEDRAIPDARDGLKPVQRRILFSMNEQGLHPSKNTVKSARIVGDCMGKYHPHGDSSIYDALVRMAQPFAMSIQLILPKGNFGDRPGGGWASSRYTESKLQHIATYMLNDLKEKSVDYALTYDNKLKEPVVLPAEFPNMIVNGVTGIAVGYATNIPPHNPLEVIEATKQYVNNPDIKLEKLMKYLPGPDFPTNGEIIGIDGIKEAYETGRGKMIIRGESRIERLPRGRSAVVFTSFPYNVNSENITKQIKEKTEKGQITGITDIKDLSNKRNGIQYTVYVKAGVNPEAVRASIYKYTEFEISFHVNAVALVDGSPTVMPLLDQFKVWADFRIETIRRRETTRKAGIDHRLHIIEGLLKALTDIDTVIKIVRTSDNASEAKEKLKKKFKLDDEQADFILAIPLRRLTKYDQLELSKEQKELQDKAKELTKLIADDNEIRKVIISELNNIKKTIGEFPRRSELIGVDVTEHQKASVEALKSQEVEITDGNCFLHLNHKGGIVRSEKEKAGTWASVIPSTVRGKFIAITNYGKAFRLESLHVNDRINPVKTILPESLKKDEYIITITPETLPEGGTGGVGIITKNGVVKITAPQWPKTQNEFQIIGLTDGDSIVAASWIDSHDDYEFAFISTDTSLLVFPANKVRPQGLSGGGMAGLKLSEGQTVVGGGIIHKAEADKAMVVTVSDQMNGKQTPLTAYPRKGRATGGVRSQALLKSETQLIAATVSAKPVLTSVQGNSVALPPVIEKRDASGKPLDDGKLL